MVRHEIETPCPESYRRGPIAVFVGLGVTVVANAIMITIALSNPSIPATADHWAESLDWDRELDRRARSAELGWSVGFTSTAHVLELRVVDADQRPILGLAGNLELRRADGSIDDEIIQLVELDDGRYRSRGPISAVGLVETRLTLRGHDPIDATSDREFVTTRWLEIGR